jgi:hypothetical protein
MALVESEMALLGYSGAVPGGFRFWAYANSGADNPAAADYFNDMADQLGTKDLIYDGSGGGFYRVSSISSGTVTVEAVTTVP